MLSVQILTNGPKSQGTIPGLERFSSYFRKFENYARDPRTPVLTLSTRLKDPCKLDISAIFRSCPKILLRLSKVGILLRQILICPGDKRSLVG